MSDAAPPPAGRFNISRWAIEHTPLTRYLLVVLMVLGVVAYLNLGQDEDPPFAFRAMVVQAFWPGATAEQVADQVTSKIERTAQDVPYSDIIRSYTRPGESLTILQIREDTPPDEVRHVWTQVRKRMGDMRHTLPQGVVGPVFNDDFGDVYGSIYALATDGFTPEEVRRSAERIRTRLLTVPSVGKVALFGVQDEKIHVDVSQRRLAAYGLDLSQVVAQLNAQNAVEGAGQFELADQTLQVRVTGALTSVDALKRLPIRAVNPVTGQSVALTLGDIATIERGYIDPATVKVRFNGQQVVAVGVSMAAGGDIVALGEALATEVAAINAELPAGLTLAQVQNQPQTVTQSVREFVQVLAEAVLVVLAVSFLSLGLHTRPLRVDMRPGLVVGVSIPLVLAITFVVMYYWGVGLHKVSLGSLIIALGLLVDDAIIAVEMMVRKLEEGHDKLFAATYAYEATAMPMLTGTLITAAGFLPIGMAKSAVGEYTFAIFAVTSAALLISWVVSVYFVPFLGMWLLRTRAEAGHGAAAADSPHELFDTPMYQRLRRGVGWCMRRGWITVAATLAVFVLGIVGMTRVQQQFFPDSNRAEILIDVWLPEGASVAASEALARQVEARVLKEKGVVSTAVWVGSGVPRFYLPLDQIFPMSNVSQLIVLSESLDARDVLRERLPALLAAQFPQARLRVKLLPSGPPVPYPVQFRVVGDSPKQVRAWADEALAILRGHASLRGVNDNWNESVRTLRVDVDQDKANALGVSSQAIAQTLRTLLSGTTVGQYREDDRLIDIVLRQPADERRVVEDVAGTYVRAASGAAVPLSQLARIEMVWEPGVIWREHRQYAVTVQGDVVEGVQGATVTQALWPQMQALKARMPPGMDIEIAGAVAESSKGEDSIVVGVPLMLFIMLTLLMVQLRSFSRTVLVVLTAPLGIAGVAGALLLLNRPFGFVALLGFIALLGMIMRNSVILIDQIEHERAKGVAPWEAVIESTVRRARPIVLTAAAAVMAMIPLSRSVFWGPMAVAIMGGLIVATVLTLLALPAMYALMFRVRPPPPQGATAV